MVKYFKDEVGHMDTKQNHMMVPDALELIKIGEYFTSFVFVY